MTLEKISNLTDLYNHIIELNKKHFPNSSLMPIPSGGELNIPKYMFVFINPTIRNISTNPNWKGIRAPFIGTKNIWRVFHKAGQFENNLMLEIEKRKTWDESFAKKVYDFLKSKSFNFTNIVKWAGENADLPNRVKIKIFLPSLIREIEIVKPQNIITFGLIPYEALTLQKIKLEEYYQNCMRNEKASKTEVTIGRIQTNIIPCYFPIGRGNPKRAVEILKLLK